MEDLILLCRRRWALPTLCALADGAPARAYPLALHMKAGRASITEGLQHLIELGYLSKPAGHGHPLRPEVCVTDRGSVLAASAAPYMRGLTDIPALGGKPLGKWGLPALAMMRAPVRFSDLRRSLPAITDRALSLTLHELETKTLLTFQHQPDTRPAIGLYQATKAGQGLITGLGP